MTKMDLRLRQKGAPLETGSNRSMNIDNMMPLPMAFQQHSLIFSKYPRYLLPRELPRGGD